LALIQAESEIEENLFIQQAYSLFSSSMIDLLSMKGLFVDGFTTNSLKEIADNEMQLIEERKALKSLIKTSTEKDEEEIEKAEKSYENKANSLTLRNYNMFLSDIINQELTEEEIERLLYPMRSKAQLSAQEGVNNIEDEEETVEIISYRKRSREKKVEAETKEEEERKKQRVLEEEQAYKENRISKLIPLDLIYCILEVDPSLSSYLLGGDLCSSSLDRRNKKVEFLSRKLKEELVVEGTGSAAEEQNRKSKRQGTIHYFADDDDEYNPEDEKENSDFSNKHQKEVGLPLFSLQSESFIKWIEKDATSLLQDEIGKFIVRFMCFLSYPYYFLPFSVFSVSRVLSVFLFWLLLVRKIAEESIKKQKRYEFLAIAREERKRKKAEESEKRRLTYLAKKQKKQQEEEDEAERERLQQEQDEEEREDLEESIISTSKDYADENEERKGRKRSSSKHFRVDEDGFPIIDFSSSEEDAPVTRAKRNQKLIKKEEKKKSRDLPVGSPSNKRKKDKDKESNKKQKKSRQQTAEEREGEDDNDLLSPLVASATGSDLSFPSDVFFREDSSTPSVPNVPSTSASFTGLPFITAYHSIPLISRDICAWKGLIVRHTISKEIGKIISFHSDDSNTTVGEKKDEKDYRVEIRTTWGDMKGKSIHFEILNKNSSEYLQFECADILLEDDEDIEEEQEKGSSLSVEEEKEEEAEGWKEVPISNKHDERSSNVVVETTNKKLSVLPPPSINHHRFITPADLKRPGKAKLIENPLISSSSSSVSAGKGKKKETNKSSSLPPKDQSVTVNGKESSKFVLPIKKPVSKEDELINAKYFEQHFDRNLASSAGPTTVPSRKYDAPSSRYHQQSEDRSQFPNKDNHRSDRFGKEKLPQSVPAPRRSNPHHHSSSPPLSPVSTSRNSSTSFSSLRNEKNGNHNSLKSVEERTSTGKREIVSSNADIGKGSSGLVTSTAPVFSSDDDTDNRKPLKKQKTSLVVNPSKLTSSSTSTIAPPPVSPSSLNPRDPRNKNQHATDKVDSGKKHQSHGEGKVVDDDITELLNKFKGKTQSESSSTVTNTLTAVPVSSSVMRDTVSLKSIDDTKPVPSSSVALKNPTASSSSSSSRPIGTTKPQIKTSFNPNLVSLKPGNRVSRFGVKSEDVRPSISSVADLANPQAFSGGFHGENYDHSASFDMQHVYDSHGDYPQQDYYPIDEQQGMVTFPDGSSASGLSHFEYNVVQPFEEYYPPLQQPIESFHPQLPVPPVAASSTAGHLDPKRARFNKNAALTKTSTVVPKGTRRTLPGRTVHEPVFGSGLPPALEIPYQQQSFSSSHSDFYPPNDSSFYPQFPVDESLPQAPFLFPPAPVLVPPSGISYDQVGEFLHPPQLIPPPDSRMSVKSRNLHRLTNKSHRPKVIEPHKKKVSTSDPEDGEVSE
jgi:hypothetical protein